MYNKIRMGIMLLSFGLVTFGGLSYSGKVSDSCETEWNFIESSADANTALNDKKDARVVNGAMGEDAHCNLRQS